MTKKISSKIIFRNNWYKTYIFQDLIDFSAISINLPCATFHFFHNIFYLAKVTKKSFKTRERFSNFLCIFINFFFLFFQFIEKTRI